MYLLSRNEYDGLKVHDYPTDYTGIGTERTSDSGITWTAGSDKQIDWAETLVKGTIRRAKELAEESVEKDLITSEEKDSFLTSLELAIPDKDDANWWIDIRDEKLTKKLYLILEDDEEAKDIVRKMA